MAGHPAAVRTFLLGLLDAAKAPARAELNALQRLNQRACSGADGLQAWDQHRLRHLAVVGPMLLCCSTMSEHPLRPCALSYSTHGSWESLSCG